LLIAQRGLIACMSYCHSRAYCYTGILQPSGLTAPRGLTVYVCQGTYDYGYISSLLITSYNIFFILSRTFLKSSIIKETTWEKNFISFLTLYVTIITYIFHFVKYYFLQLNQLLA
jgi:hypothetical protein